MHNQTPLFGFKLVIHYLLNLCISRSHAFWRYIFLINRISTVKTIQMPLYG